MLILYLKHALHGHDAPCPRTISGKVVIPTSSPQGVHDGSRPRHGDRQQASLLSQRIAEGVAGSRSREIPGPSRSLGKRVAARIAILPRDELVLG